MSQVRRRQFLFSTVALLVTRSGLAQQPAKVLRVGVLALGQRSAEASTAFESALSARGWTKDQIRFEYRFAQFNADRLPALATELVRLDVDVIVAGMGTTDAASRATSLAPIVMTFGLPAVEAGLVGSLGRPGNNITGVTGDVTAEVMGKRLQLLRETVPRAKRLAFLQYRFPGSEVWLRNLEDAALQLGFRLQLVEIHAPDGLREAFDAIRKSEADCLFCGGDPVTFPLRAQIVQFAMESKLPGVHGAREWAEVGGLLSYGTPLPEIYREVVNYVDKILRGTAPRDLPILRPTKYELAVNLKSAKALGITVPRSILLRADRVIE